jgi:hypothetical protein
MLHKDYKTKGSKKINLFIDSTNIYNKNDGYGFNQKKKETKMSTICDDNKIILSHTIIDTIDKSKQEKQNKNISNKINKKSSNKNNTFVTKKTLRHDSQTI